MADLNALIAQGYQFQAPPDPFVQYGKMQQLQQNEQANQLNQMKMQEAQAAAAERNALRGLDPASSTYLTDIKKINPKLGFEFAKLQQEAKTAGTEGQIKDTKLLADKLALLPDMYARADTPDKYIALHESIHADPILGNYLKNIGATKEQGRAKINEAITSGKFDDLRAGSMRSVAQVLTQIEDAAYGQNRNAPAPQGQLAPGAVPMGAANISVTPQVSMPAEPMVAPAVMGLNADQTRAELAVAPNALAPQVAPVNALAAAPTVSRVKQIDDRLLEGNTSRYKNSKGWADEKEQLKTERADLVKEQPDIGLMRALNLPNTQAGYATLQALKNSSPTEFERAIKAANLNPEQTIAANRAYLTHKTTHAPGTVVNVSQSTEKKYGEAFGGKIADRDVAMLDVAAKAPDLAANANRVLSILSQGNVFTGSAADIKLNMARALNLAGAGNDEKIANTELLVSGLARQTLGAVKSSGLGTGQGFTDKDLKFLEDAEGGRITLNAQTIQRLAELSHSAADKSAAAWNKRVKEIPKSATEGTGLSTEAIVVPKRLGATPAAPAVGTESKGYRFKGGDPAVAANWEKM